MINIINSRYSFVLNFKEQNSNNKVSLTFNLNCFTNIFKNIWNIKIKLEFEKKLMCALKWNRITNFNYEKHK